MVSVRKAEAGEAKEVDHSVKSRAEERKTYQRGVDNCDVHGNADFLRLGCCGFARQEGGGLSEMCRSVDEVCGCHLGGVDVLEVVFRLSLFATVVQ